MLQSRFLLNCAIQMKKMSSNALCSRLNGRVAIVTASTEGIGFAIAQRLAREGAKVVVSSRKEKNVEKAVNELKKEGLNVTGVVCHVSKAEDRRKLFMESEKLGGLDILVSNAAVNPEIGGVLDASETAWDKIFDVNVKSSFLLAKEALPQIRKSKFGRIVFVSSIAAYAPLDVLGAYSVSKTALLGLTKAAANQLATENITVNCVAPGVVQTKFASTLTESEATREEVLKRIPLGRLGVPDDISGIVALLVSDDGSYITGETIVAAGGMISHL
ncbi:dehydrogenase/reductase SDR family member 4 [Coccinella septempunctata]|uniref:dehydrogenase/reductase SDR family member 4 n=1 Tax=Coccinella septempunctata TaxID=41139 RepID=UPI001D0617A6|nr:dehydrogenase/reductase SDR family member 4 [Coccinella septempunctata]